MKIRTMSEEGKERLHDGCFLGLVLFASSGVSLSFCKDMEVVGWMLPWIPVALFVYLVLGNGLIWLHDRPEGGHISAWVKGSAAVYWIGILMVAFAGLALFVPAALRYMILVNLVVLIVCWILDYCSFAKTAKELNRGRAKGRYLVVDISESPRSVEAFCREIEDYCRKNRRSLEFISRGKPAEIQMDGERYTVDLDCFYSQFGPMYALKFRQGK